MTFQWNHNLVVTFVYRITFSITAGLWQSGTSSNYIYYLENQSNSLVGLVQGVQGLCTSIASFPFGFVADRSRRDVVLKVCGVCGFVGIVLHVLAIILPKVPLPFYQAWDIKFLLLLIGFVFWGIVQAGNPIVESILADSVPTGGRSRVYTAIFFVAMLGRSVGPVVVAIIFWAAGNSWSIKTLGICMLVAMGLSLIPIATLFFFNDNLSLGDESEAIRRQSYDGTARAAELPIDPGSKNAHDTEQNQLSRQHRARSSRRFLLFRVEAIPYILSAADLITGLASGCTIKFFPIFFADAVKLNPIAVNLIMAAQPILIALCASLAQVLSRFLGRVQVVLLLRFLGVSLITIMGLFQSSWSMPPLIVTLYLMRTGVNNSGYPIQKAILMDYVPKNLRGRWGALDSFATFGWSGSALLGGILIDKAGFDTCFIITAAMQGCGMLVLLPLLISVPKQERLHPPSHGVEEPLLEETDAVEAGGELGYQEGSMVVAVPSSPHRLKASDTEIEGIDPRE